MADTEDHSTKHIIQSLLVNVTIAAIKAVAAVLTKSGSMLAEAIHSSADCGNQVLLLIGVKSARRKPDATHPLGYGRDVYFWSFIVALLLFTGGGVFSVYEGIHKILAPRARRAGVGSARRSWASRSCSEGDATLSNIREMNQRRSAGLLAISARDQGHRPRRRLRRKLGGGARPRAGDDRAPDRVARPGTAAGTESGAS